MAQYDVTSPDGQKYRVTAPEGASQEEALAYAQKQMVGMEHAPAQKTPEDALLRAAQGVGAYGTGLLRGAAGLVGMLSDVNNFITQSTGQPSWRKMPGGSEDVKKLAQDVTGITSYQPQTQMEKYLAAGGEAQAAMVPGNAKQALVGFTSGLGGEAAANNFTEHPILSRIMGQLGVLGAAAPFGMRTPATVRATESYLKELGPEGLLALDAARKQASNTLHVPTLLTQGSPHDELSGVVRALVASPYGGDVRQVLRQQSPAGETAIKGMYEGLPGGPGQDIADAILGVGKAAIQTPKDVRSGITTPLYTAAGKDTVDPTPIVAAILAKRQELNIPAAVPPGKSMQRLQAMIDTAAGKQVPVLELDTVSKLAKDAAEAARLKGNNVKMLANKAVASAIDETTRAASSSLRGAAAQHKSLSESLVNPVENTLAPMFPESMRKGKTGDWNTFQSAMDSASASDIAAIGTHLRRVDPTGEAFPSIFRHSLQQKAEAALAPVAGRTPDTAFNEFANAVAGPKGSTKRDAFEAKIGQVALSRGQDPAVAIRGANDTIDALYVISRERGTAGSGAQAVNAAASDWLSRILRAASFTAPLRGLGYARELAASKQLAKDLSEAFTSETGVNKLIEIANFSAARHKIKAVARGLSTLEVPAADENNSNQLP